MYIMYIFDVGNKIFLFPFFISFWKMWEKKAHFLPGMLQMLTGTFFISNLYSEGGASQRFMDELCLTQQTDWENPQFLNTFP
jgi:hypothetical protein